MPSTELDPKKIVDLHIYGLRAKFGERLLHDETTSAGTGWEFSCRVICTNGDVDSDRSIARTLEEFDEVLGQYKFHARRIGDYCVVDISTLDPGEIDASTDCVIEINAVVPC